MNEFLLLTAEPVARKVRTIMGSQFILPLSSWADRAQAKPCLRAVDAIRQGTIESLREMDRDFAGGGYVSSIHLPKLGTETRKGRRPG
jgi:hypothetical protein